MGFLNLREAEKSLTFFTELLKSQCRFLALAVSMEAGTTDEEYAPIAKETKGKALSAVEKTYRESLALSIRIQEALVKKIQNAIRTPAELAAVMTASNRLTEVAQEAQVLIERTRPRENPQPTKSFLERFREFQEMRSRERAEAAERQRKEKLN